MNNNLPVAESLIDAELLHGDYIATHTFGWTQFDIDPETQALTVTTYGIEPYSEARLLADPGGIVDREPVIVSQFVVNPKLTPQARLMDGTLVITGGQMDDEIEIDRESQSSENLLVTINGEVAGEFAPSAVEQIRILGLGGDDRIRSESTLGIDTVQFGGAGNDLLLGGSANDLLSGGSGDDVLFGFTGLDILLGGSGQDILFGGRDSDLLIGNRVNHSAAALDAIFAKWSDDSDPLADRIDDLRNGDGVPALNDTTVVDDLTQDFLLGSRGLDWYFEGLNDQSQRQSLEPLN